MLLRTDTAKHFDDPQFPNLQPGLHPDGCHYILDQGVRMIGIDAWGLDRAPRDMAADHKKGIPNSLWPTHMVGRDREYLQIERLANLDALPPTGFTVVAFPVKIEQGTAGWSRVVAMIQTRITAMKLITFGVETMLGEASRVGALVGETALDLAALYAWALSEKDVYAARELAEATIPPDMTEFLARWPVAKDIAEGLIDFRSGSRQTRSRHLAHGLPTVRANTGCGFR